MNGSKCEKVRPRFLSKIDWELLKCQKQELINMTYDTGLTNVQAEAIDGITTLLDSIQDFAVDVMGIDEETVFKIG